MRKIIIITTALAVFSALTATARAPKLYFDLVRSEMARCPDASYLDGRQGTLKWDYTTGLELKAFLDVYCHSEQSEESRSILSYVDAWYDTMIDENGRIHKYKVSNYSTDHICPGRTLFQLYDLTGKEKYRMAMDTLYTQIQGMPRTPEGGFWHKKVYPYQMWLDGLYMAQPFYAEYTSRYVPENERLANYVDITRHFLIVAGHTFDYETGLYRHAWDSSHKMFWADPRTGQSDHAWGRALGWYCMGIVETLPLLPDGTPGKKELIDVLKEIYKILPYYADPKTGMWYQVLDRPGAEGNYVEATCSAMFTYAMLKGRRLGYLDIPEKTCKKTYKAFVKTFITREKGLVNLNRCCEVAGLGGKDNRRGDYQYYINERVRSNDPKGIGPAIWAALEMDK